MGELSISKFQTDATDRDTLEKIFVGNHSKSLLKRLKSEVETALKNKSPRHYLIIGQRGIGKTHLITLLYYSLANKIKDTKIIKLAEEEYSVYRVSDLLLRVFKSLGLNIPPNIEKYEEDDLVKLLIDELKKNNKSYLILLENFNQILDTQMDEIEVKRFRGILQKEKIFSIVATSSLSFKGVLDHNAPFFDFFEIIYLKQLNINEITELVKIIGKIDKNQNIDNCIKNIEIIRKLTGGIPRIVFIVYDLSKGEKIKEIEEVLFNLLDEYTPYYQDVFNVLSSQERLVFDTLVALNQPSSPTEIAKSARINRGIVTTVLRRLEKEGYVISRKLGKTAKYEVRDRFFRIWREVRREPFGRKKIQMLIEFLQLWYRPAELEKKFQKAIGDKDFEDAKYIFWSLSGKIKSIIFDQLWDRYLIENAIGLRNFLYEVVGKKQEFKTFEKFEEYDHLFNNKKFQQIIDKAEKDLEKNSDESVALLFKAKYLFLKGKDDDAIKVSDHLASKSQDNLFKAMGFLILGGAMIEQEKLEKALENLEKAYKLFPDDRLLSYYKGSARFYKGIVLKKMKRYEASQNCFDEALKIAKKAQSTNLTHDILVNKGNVYLDKNNPQEALKLFSKVLKLDPNRPSAILGMVKCYSALEVETGRWREAIEFIDKYLRNKKQISKKELDTLLKLKYYSLLFVITEEFEKKDYKSAENDLINFIEFTKNLKIDKDMKKSIIDLLAAIIGIKDFQALRIILKELSKEKRFENIFSPVKIALEIVETKNLKKYYDVQIEVREIVAEIVRKLTKSEDLIPEELAIKYRKTRVS